jgi:hypothetical protein
VIASRFTFGHIKNQEIALWDKRNIAFELADGKIAPYIAYEAKLMERTTSDVRAEEGRFHTIFFALISILTVAVRRLHLQRSF